MWKTFIHQCSLEWQISGIYTNKRDYLIRMANLTGTSSTDTVNIFMQLFNAILSIRIDRRFKQNKEMKCS